MLAPLLIAVLLVPVDSTWPEFLGVSVADSKRSAPETWTPETNIGWKTELPGYGQSSPVIWGDKVFLTSVSGAMKEKLQVHCLDLNSGQLQWTQTFDASEQVESSVYVSRAAPTAVVDDQRVIAFFESGDLMALDHSGNSLWQRSLTKDYGKFENRFCLGASLAQDGDSVFVLADHEGPSYLAAFSKETGKTEWKTARESRVSWSSPIYDTIDGQPLLIVSSQGSVDGYDPRSGELAWTIGDLGGNTVASPYPMGNGRYLIGASPGQRGEDVDSSRRTNFCLQVSHDNDGWNTEIAWRSEKANCSFGSPMAYRGIAYWVNRTGVVYGFDSQTGEELFTERLDESCWATPLGIGDHVYFFGRTGTTTVLATGREFKTVASNRLWPEVAGADQPGNFEAATQYAAVPAGNKLLVRSGQMLYCIQAP